VGETPPKPGHVSRRGTAGLDAIVIGAGPAGLATSRELARSGISHRVLERGGEPGHTWANLYDSLVLHTGRHLSSLPGLAFPSGTALFPSRRVFVDYLHRYAETFRLPVETGAEVMAVTRPGDRWQVQLRSGTVLEARTLVTATGIVANPHVPGIPGREHFTGRVIHSVAYRRPNGMAGRRVLVVGAGNSAGEIAVELARHGADVSLAVRSGAAVVPRELFGIPIQYLSVLVSPLPRSFVERVTTMVGGLRGPRVLPPPPATDCPRVPLIGLALADCLRNGVITLRDGLTSFTAEGVRFTDGSEQAYDEVILATGYRAALGFLEGFVSVDGCGFGHRLDRVVSRDHPNLFFVGHNYDARGGLYNISLDAPRAAREVGRACSENAHTIERGRQEPFTAETAETAEPFKCSALSADSAVKALGHATGNGRFSCLGVNAVHGHFVVNP
jgi:cation diffusion facilitator CzcD-associated flavoprotein CzcO